MCVCVWLGVERGGGVCVWVFVVLTEFFGRSRLKSSGAWDCRTSAYA